MSWSRTLAPFGGLGRDADHLRDRVNHLSRDISAIARTLRHDARVIGHDARDQAGKLGGELVEQLTPVARRLGKQARSAGRRLKADPAPAVIALGTAVLVASLLLSRR